MYAIESLISCVLFKRECMYVRVCVCVCASVHVLCSFLKYVFKEHIQLNACCLFLCASCARIEHFSANVNSRSRSLYAVARSSVCLSSVCHL